MTLTGFVSAVILITEVQMLTIIRGLPGSGKSTLAKTISEKVCEADQYFMVYGEYIFVPADIVKAHIACQKKVDSYLRAGVDCVVSNTFSKKWEIEPYIKLCEKHGVDYKIIDLFDAGLSDEQLFSRNVHEVPMHVIKAMRERWEK
jgi:predicted kinase